MEFKNSRPCLPRTGGRLISLSRHVNARRCNLEKVRPVFFFSLTRFPVGRKGATAGSSLHSWTRFQPKRQTRLYMCTRVSLSNFSKKDRVTVLERVRLILNRTIPSHKSSTSEIDVNFFGSIARSISSRKKGEDRTRFPNVETLGIRKSKNGPITNPLLRGRLIS